MKIFNSTKKWTKWWARRKIDWKTHYMNPNHPHRIMLAGVLKHMRWFSLMEVGCGAGANLVQIANSIPGRQIGGVDINPDAIKFAETQLTNAMLRVCPGDDMMLSDQFTDVVISDMYMIYVSPRRIKKQLNELKRVGRNYVVLFELHSESWWQRFVIKWKEGYNMYDWKKLLEKHGFQDVGLLKIPKDAWPESDLQQKYGHIVVATIPKYY